jgi:hypothetical protein
LFSHASRLVSLIEEGFVFNVYGFDPNDCSSSAINKEGASAIGEPTFLDGSDSDGG